jgi:predicted Zn-dependent peptidase
MQSRMRSLFIVTLIATMAATLSAQSLADLEKRITVRTLDNGLTVIVMERPEAPVFSFFTHVDVGKAQEVPGITGLAHMFEHMAFKGTPRIGTKNYEAERVALERVEQTYLAYDRARRAPTGRDEAQVAALEAAWREAMAAADEYVESNEFDRILSAVGAVGMNAFTSADETGFFYSLPSNQFELWAHLESERFLRPVLREFYKERDVVMEERRMQVENQPISRMLEQFTATAFSAHPYGQPLIGWPSDLQTFSATDAAAFYRRYYVPANMTIAVVGDVRAREVMPVIERYFSRLPAGPPPEPLRTVELPQQVEKSVISRGTAQPFYIEGYHRPAATHPDNAVYTVIQDLMSAGRTSRLYRALVRDQQIAAGASGFDGYPGTKYPHLFAFLAIPTPGNTPAQMAAGIQEELERLRNEDVSAEELAMVKTRAQANLVRRLTGNQGLAMQLATAHRRHGDWRELFREVERIQAVTAEDIRRVANQTFIATNRTVGMIETIPPPAAPVAEGGAQ